MENDFSALKSIQELKNLLDSGAITQQEYEVLKRKIIFGNTNPPASSPEPPVTPVRPEVPKTVGSPPPVQTAANIPAADANPLTSEYNRVIKAKEGEARDNLAVRSANYNDSIKSLTFDQPEEPAGTKGKDWLLTTLIILAVVLLIGLVGYQLFSDSESERLTSISGPDTEEVTTPTSEAPVASTEPEPAVAEQAPTTQPENATPAENQPAEATAPATGTTPAATSGTAVNTEITAPAPAPPVAAPKVTEEEALNKIKDRLQAYYADIKSAPFAAQNHFAPSVERYYTLVGTTPQAINENISSYHFNEFQDSQSSIEEGTLKMTSSGDNGYEVTYIEHGTAFRKSKGQKQETTARVRARFDKDFKMTYFRQEQLLENKFIDE